MAEKVANFTSTTDVKPSIFELIAQKSLNDTLYDAFQKLVEVVVHLKPNRLNFLLGHYDETFLIFNGLLQYFYLKRYNATFGEHFYNLQRVNAKSGKYNRKDRFYSLLFVIILPYIYKKLANIASEYELEKAAGKNDNSLRHRSKRFFHETFLVLNVSWYGWLLVNYLRYAANQTDFCLPELKLIHTKLIYANELEINDGFWSSFINRQLSFKEGLVGFIENSLKSFVELGAFMIQFLNVWNSEQKNYFHNLNGLPQVTPPKDRVDIYGGKCPICLQSWKIPTVLPVSGYVFCLRCIMDHLRKYENCPVTNLPANNLDLIRLYDI